MEPQDRIGQSPKEVKKSRITWKGSTIVILTVLAFAFTFWKGYQFGLPDEDSDLQAEIDAATNKNEQLEDLLEGANLELLHAESENDIRLAQMKESMQEEIDKLAASQVIVPASKCKGSDDFYGTSKSQRFNEKLRIQKEKLFRGE